MLAMLDYYFAAGVIFILGRAAVLAGAARASCGTRDALLWQRSAHQRRLRFPWRQTDVSQPRSAFRSCALERAVLGERDSEDGTPSRPCLPLRLRVSDAPQFVVPRCPVLAEWSSNKEVVFSDPARVQLPNGL